jgi:hypothetical protein
LDKSELKNLLETMRKSQRDRVIQRDSDWKLMTFWQQIESGVLPSTRPPNAEQVQQIVQYERLNAEIFSLSTNIDMLQAYLGEEAQQPTSGQ